MTIDPTRHRVRATCAACVNPHYRPHGRESDELIAAKEEAAAATAMQHAVVTASPDVIFVLNTSTQLIEWTNRTTADLIGYDITHRAWGTLFADGTLSDAHRPLFRDAVARALTAADHEVITLDHEIRHADGSLRWLSHRITILARDPNGVATQLVGVTRDVTAATRAVQQARHAAEHDELTQLPNRTQLVHRLASIIESCRLNQTEVTVLYCDLDRFKNINDTAGHAAGDFVLKQTAGRIQSTVRPSDVVARVGGDEFVIVLQPPPRTPVRGRRVPGESAARAAADVGSRLINAVREPIWFGNVEHVLSVSIGIFCGLPLPYDATEELTPEEQVLQDADTAMNQAKHAGRDRLVLFERRMRADVVENARIEQVLRRALRQSGAARYTPSSNEPSVVTHERAGSGLPRLYPVFQPIYDLDTDKLVGFEALARLQDESGRHIAPDCFIRVAESTGLVHGLGRQIMRLSCLQLAEWQTQTPSLVDATIAVNVSGVQAQGDSLASDVEDAMRESCLSPHNLILELTETALLRASPGTINVLQNLRDEGVGIAIDDFGTGYASLRYLATLPVSVLKIDKTFTAGLPHNQTSAKIVKAVAGLAADLGMACVVEGVETELQQRSLPPGVHVQGWLRGRPAQAEHLDVGVLTAHLSPDDGTK